ncbi:hypothetical protein [Limisalsivibrio acetivorans]|uniref:hypothetical protein n=1 Tax=Limisalsivibrio acetivorans TaxID=1304888 RepID=UPI0003B6DC54|nr:hypothetical protein [Limisalsivibrio acetivorans]
MKPRWMLVREDMTWDEVKFEINGEECSVFLPKKRKEMDCIIEKSNEVSKVYRVRDDMTDEIYDIVDFSEMDKMFEENGIIFRNRRGLHNEVRRYIDFSIS